MPKQQSRAPKLGSQRPANFASCLILHPRTRLLRCWSPILLLSLGAAASPVSALSQDAVGTMHSRSEQAVRRLQDDLIEAYKRHEVAALNRILADEYTFTNDEGEVETKRQVLAAFTAGGDRTITSYVIDDDKVRVYGEAAVMTYHYVSHETYEGRESGGSFRITRVFVKRRGRWQMVAGHETRIVER